MRLDSKAVLRVLLAAVLAVPASAIAAERLPSCAPGPMTACRCCPASGETSCCSSRADESQETACECPPRDFGMPARAAVTPPPVSWSAAVPATPSPVPPVSGEASGWFCFESPPHGPPAADARSERGPPTLSPRS